MKIEDEHGTPWVVEAGDPARKAVNTLKAAGFTYIVLTRSYLRGLTTDAHCGTIDVTDPRLVRLYDCEVTVGNYTL